MSKTKRFEILLVVLTVLALGAGLTAGLLSSRLPAQSDQDSSISPLQAELDLTPAQREQMKQIWEGAQAKVLRAFNDAQALQKNRDDEIIRMLTDEQREKFAELSKKYADQYDELQQNREKVLNNAVERTMEILNDKQRIKYQAILKARLGEASLAPASRPQ
ncbi:MAG TPA: hypothetical protein VHM90_17205 [Phycisphaerae bacterium]|nr:hypothetical protein [Phycisphaerae bacterium]